jgi:hypothetical protein
MSDSITTLGDYAFYGMSLLESVDLSDNLTSIGKCAFAFCRSLEGVSLPAGVTSIGESAFEGCSSLKSIKLPSAVTTLGERAFAFCRSLTTALIPCQIETLAAWTFKDCTSLSSVTLLKGFGSPDDSAFEGAKISADKIGTIDNPDATTTVTVHYRDEAGNALKESKSTVKNIGETYSEVAPTIEGYNVKGEKSYTGTADGRATIELTFKYEKQEAVTETPEAPEQTDAPKVLVIRDSYSDTLAPFLSEGFSEVHLFDVRYNLTPISQYVKDNNIDQVIVLYSFANFVQGQNIFALSR